MKIVLYRLLLAAVAATFGSCSEKPRQPESARDSAMITQPLADRLYSDTSVTMFGDQAYTLTLHILDEDRQYDNALLKLTRSENNTTKTLLADTLSCQFLDAARKFAYEDYNRDGVADLIIYQGSGARANEFYYLYLIDTATKTLHRVRGFEEVATPQYDSVNNIIWSFCLSGTDYMTFYKIAGDSAVNLGVHIDQRHDEKGYRKYERELEKVKRKFGWK